MIWEDSRPTGGTDLNSTSRNVNTPTFTIADEIETTDITLVDLSYSSWALSGFKTTYSLLVEKGCVTSVTR